MAVILVTGGAGYIGSHTVSKLIDAKHQVIIVDDLSTGFNEAVHPKTTFIQTNVCDTAVLSKVMKDHRVDSIIHFAAKLNVQESTMKPLEYYQTNTLGVISVATAALENKIEHIVFSSTAALFGNLTENRTILEDDPKLPLNPYGYTKLFSEQVLRDTAATSALRYVFLRYFNVAGAAINAQNGQRTANAFHLVHLASQAAMGKRAQLSIFGEDYPTPDGTCIRDYIHVEDLANIHILALEYLLKGGTSDDFNCGYGFGYSVKQVINTMQEVTGVNFKTVIAARRPGDAASLVANSTKLKNKLKWQPQFEDLKLICRTAFDWEKKLS